MDIINEKNTTVVICCAGMGTRLGIGTTKALVDICGVPLILRQLEMLKDYDDIRIVVGYMAEKVIETVLEYRKDIMFVFNYEYEKTGVADSLRNALVAAREYILVLDGDTIENKEDFNSFLKYPNECIAISDISSEEPVMAHIVDGMVTKLSKETGDYQWPGIAKIHINRITDNSSHVYEVINKVLPIESYFIRMREIDTPEDYENAIIWYKDGCMK